MMTTTIHRRAILLAALLLVLVSAVHAGDAFELGVAAFKQNDFATAASHFEQARRQQGDSPILSYNLGACYYKQGDFAQAKHHFAAAADDPALAGPSYYNLGLLALRDGNQAAAYDFFAKSIDSSEDEAVDLLAARKMQELEQRREQYQEQQRSSAAERLSGFISVALAYDDNAMRINDDIPSAANRADSYIDFFGQISYQLSGERNDGVQIKAGAIIDRYDDLDAYDETLFNLGLYLYKPLAGWHTRAGIVYYHDTLGSEAFQQRGSLQLRGDRYYASDQRLRLTYDLTRYDALDVRYAYLDGVRQRLGVENRSRFDDDEFRLGYRFELNDRDDYAVASSYYPYSPTRHNLYATLKHDFSSTWSAELSLDYRDSDYREQTVIAAVEQGVRQERRMRYGLSAIHRYSRDTEFEASWRYSDNDSNFADESYSGNLFMFSVNHYF